MATTVTAAHHFIWRHLADLCMQIWAESIIAQKPILLPELQKFCPAQKTSKIDQNRHDFRSWTSGVLQVMSCSSTFNII